ncbi:MAG: type III-A CRISPR-associated protein Cas10/Csm1 [Pseudothermotoga sp.]
MSNEREVITIGALIHDIGKLVRRAGLRGKTDKHTLAGSLFIENVQVNGKRVFAQFQDFIYYHHEADLNQTQNPLVWFVCYADNIASSERQVSEDEGFEEKRAIENILARVWHDDKENNSYFKPLSLDELENPTSEPLAHQNDFKKLYENLVRDLKDYPFSVETLRFLLYKYLSFVPQSTHKSGVMDISLYDHLKVTAMIALSLYDYVQKCKISIGKYEDLKKLEDKETLLLVEGDVSGIQRFITRVSSRGALRSFRGRSLFIDLLQEIVVDKILDETQFYRTNVHFVGGGHFYLVISNTKENIEKINQVKTQVNQWLLDKSTDLKLIIEHTPMTLKDIKDPEKVFKNLNKKMRLAKLRMYSEDELHQIFDLVNIKTVHGLETCKVCGKRTPKIYPLREDQDLIACEFCKQMYEIGKEILESKYFSEDPQGSIEILGRRYSFTDRPLKGRNYVLGLTKVNQSPSSDLIFIDVVNYAKYQELADLAAESSGKKLACLQADLDSLGKIFSTGLEIRTLSRISTLSRLLTFFFKHKIRKLVKGKNIAVIYSGGDDLFIIGGWEDVLDFTHQMQKEFRSFTGGNNDLTYTAAFVLCDEKESISSVKEAAESAEKKGKQKGKNCLVLSHGMQRTRKDGRVQLERVQIVSWNDFMEKTYKLYETLSKIATSVDRSVIRKVLELSLEDSPMNKAFLAYIQARENAEDKEFAESVRTQEIPALNAVIQLIDLKARRGDRG